MNTKAAIITGASSGLGLECARALLRSDPSWHVVLPVRDIGRGNAAVDELGDPARCTVMPMDLASLASVRAFTEAFHAAGLPPLHAIVCNAGVQVVSGTEYTQDGVEMTFGVNHLGHFALVQGLLAELTLPARILVVSSGTHDPAKFTGMPDPRYTSAAGLAHPDESEPADGRRRYTTSKLCNVLFTYELDRRLGGGVTVNAFDPGLMPGSGLARDYSPLGRFAWRYLFPALRVLPNVNSTRASGRRLAALVNDARFDGVSGRYFEGRRPIKSSEESYDRDKACDLFQTSDALLTHACK
ncbi:alanine-phosphoribitol ligase [Mycobacterium sp. ACS1612]|uniref:SDR family NAD(P)-dependent oxidoreductase n=1 Tax=Mycobacterium sp. ACS1612 TaxID=1834117 RepID=UPI0008002C8C|nr:SDR family NAD(P)-dependent oxidoreductase [Mycobacterium sp. ACS1612]OBF35881.1 alanine-phosphoribitol ligase [Mycobacterium sp. ACS1612]